MKITIATTMLLLAFCNFVSLAAATEPPDPFELLRDHAAIILLIDPAAGRIVDANKAAVSYYGYPYERLLQMSLQQINTLSPQETEQEIQRAEREQRNYFIFRHRLANGAIHPVEVYSSPLEIQGQRRLVSIIHDAADRDVLEESIVQSEARLRYAEKVAELGHWTLDLESNSYLFSEGALELLGLDDPVQPLPVIRQMILPDERATMIEAHNRLLLENIPYNVHLRFERPDGRIIDLNSQGIYDAREDQIFGIIHDITSTQEAMRLVASRTAQFNHLALMALVLLLAIIILLYYAVRRSKRAEAALKLSHTEVQESFDMTQLLLNSTAEGIYGVDRQGICTFCNSASLRILGYAQQAELIGHNIHDTIHHSHADGSPFPAAQCSLSNNIEKPVHSDEELFWRADGRGIPVEYRSYPLQRNGVIIGAVVTFLDISERKAQQAALQQKNQEMEDFFYSVSHDLKSPLVTIKSFLGMLRQDLHKQDKERVDEDLHYINGAADRMNDLLAALLQLSRVGRTEDPPETISAAKLVEQIQVSLSGQLREKQIDVRIGAIPYRLYGDPVRLGQIWQNLIENAGKYLGEQPQPQIDIGVEETGGVPVFFVRDNGIGIDRQHTERIFALFAQLDSRSPGCGLGLPMVKKIVELYQGRVWFESGGKGQGCCFYFTIPKALVTHEEGR